MTQLSTIKFRIFSICTAFLLLESVSAQNIISEMDHDARHTFDRMIILSGGSSSLHTSIFPYWRSDLVEMSYLFGINPHTSEDDHDIQRIHDQNNEFRTFSDSSITLRYRESRRPLWYTFYKTPAHLYQVDVKDFYLRVNPLITIGAGRETQESVTTFINQRGLAIRGGIGHNVYFHTSVYDSQIRFPNYINRFTDSLGVVPGASLYKNYESAFLNFTEGRDFLLANAYVGVDLGKYFGLQLGHNQHFIGDGIRSLFLSDFSTPFFSLKINTRIWKLHYQNIFAELAADNFVVAFESSKPIPKKYMATHYLSFQSRRNLSFGLFETVIFDRDNNQFELQYLNPVILYRTVEGAIGTPDNVMLGINSRWDIKKSISLYGQFLIDDINFGEIFNGNLDWWGNKFGHQLGAKYINAAGISNFDLQVEWNSVRPYTYSHYDQNANYSHYKQALAHPLGANFSEVIFSMHYRVSPKLSARSSIYFMKKGEDAVDSVSLGGNILTSNQLRPGDFNHTLGQGVNTDIVFWTSSLTYELSSGLYIDLQYLYRNKSSEDAVRNLKTNLFQATVRLNMARREDVF